MYFKFIILKTNIKYNSNITEEKTPFFRNESIFLFLNDNLNKEGYFAIGEKKGFEVLYNNHLSFEKLDTFIELENEWKFGFLTYDLKNNTENLDSKNNDNLNFPLLYFFIPKTLLKYKDGEFTLIYGDETLIDDANKFIETQTIVLNLKLKPTLNKKNI